MGKNGADHHLRISSGLEKTETTLICKTQQKFGKVLMMLSLIYPPVKSTNPISGEYPMFYTREYAQKAWNEVSIFIRPCYVHMNRFFSQYL
jgi:hypothetical protein